MSTRHFAANAVRRRLPIRLQAALSARTSASLAARY
jgi:hypothetical protein